MFTLFNLQGALGVFHRFALKRAWLLYHSNFHLSRTFFKVFQISFYFDILLRPSLERLHIIHHRSSFVNRNFHEILYKPTAKTTFLVVINQCFGFASILLYNITTGQLALPRERQSIFLLFGVFDQTVVTVISLVNNRKCAICLFIAECKEAMLQQVHL